MIVPQPDERPRSRLPVITFTLLLLNLILFVWDREGRFWGPNLIFGDLMMRPREVVEAIFGGQDGFPVVTLFTSMFLHANPLHLIGNLLFLVMFGVAVEEALGSARYALYYLFWGLCAAAAQIYVEPSSVDPILGASGAIGGVLGAYFLLFPTHEVEFFVPFFPTLRPAIPAWILLGVWFLYQVIIPQEGVANWAHAGGFLAGMVTILILGGREAVLRRASHLSPLEENPVV